MLVVVEGRRRLWLLYIRLPHCVSLSVFYLPSSPIIRRILFAMRVCSCGHSVNVEKLSLSSRSGTSLMGSDNDKEGFKFSCKQDTTELSLSIVVAKEDGEILTFYWYKSTVVSECHSLCLPCIAARELLYEIVWQLIGFELKDKSRKSCCTSFQFSFRCALLLVSGLASLCACQKDSLPGSVYISG